MVLVRLRQRQPLFKGFFVRETYFSGMMMFFAAHRAYEA